MKVKQGHTKFKVVVYEPGKIEGYDDRHLAVVYTCMATNVERSSKTVHYTTEGGPYMAHENYWNNRLFSTRRKALQEAHRRIDEINKAIEGTL